jgi:DegV family protein with EDD domain
MPRRSKSERVAVVTDSTANLPAETVAEHGITVIPLRVSVGARTSDDGVDISAAELTAALRDRVPVTTSRPTPEQFAGAYRECLRAGANRVVSIHLSAALSGTWESATLAAQDFDYGVVRVIDARSTAMALGFAVLAAVQRAAAGGTAADVAGAAADTVDRTRTMFYVDTLEYLRRGGRIGTATALLATSLSVKPLLQVAEGQIVALEKVRTASKAIGRLVQLSTQSAGDGPVDVAVHHLDAPERAEQVASHLRSELLGLRRLHVAELGAVVGAHLGPGVLGTVIVRGSASE